MTPSEGRPGRLRLVRRGPLRPAGTRRTGPVRRFGRTVSLLAAVLLVGGMVWLCTDFLRFVETVATVSRPEGGKADAIVVLTGGKERIPGGLDLLRDGRAERMLISGVGSRVSEHALLARAPSVAAGLADCCIDIGYKAANTIGNADEARAWAEARGFHSLFVVTSAYHIPRTLAEFQQALPGRELIPWPVRDEAVNMKHWYDRPRTVKVLIREYLKYLAVRIRLAAERAGLVAPAVPPAMRPAGHG
ncbi:YdcF family protein [Pseudoxanthobacter sp.]|uniref:YdcF family protein n=1 Tax=Pseudoxanthobacter sp. TaxID=1925742 RepID=UPI002FE42097